MERPQSLIREPDALTERWLIKPAKDTGNCVWGRLEQVVTGLQVDLGVDFWVRAAQGLTKMAETDLYPLT